ncbi:TerC family protein [Rhodoferax sp.]|uniref:TerC family protein n=1 Tax=Rhodoferax sp. TaxID=50421 RepID=UPI00260F5627|nr:TerC family protein [Rhodoferax sp.]MDD5481156.1 TerC family protein [Rhodoferax sp.]
MELFSAPWWSALLAIVLIDLVLAGDNAIVIALAARNLPAHLKTKAIVWGTVGAIVVRSIMTIGVVWLLKIPGLMLVGGLGLVWIAYKLLADDAGDAHSDPGANTFWGAMKTIIVADALMGVDNVLGVAGVAHGAFDLVIIGLLISVPIVVFGSSVVLKLVERFPIIIQAGAAVLAFTAAKMLVNEPLLSGVFGNVKVTLTDAQQASRWTLELLVVLGVLGAGAWHKRQAKQAASNR